MREVYTVYPDDTTDSDRDEPLTAVAYLYETGDTTTLIDILTGMLVATGLTEEAVAADLEAKVREWLREQQEQCWEAT